jgi:hypothetical protein
MMGVDSDYLSFKFKSLYLLFKLIYKGSSLIISETNTVRFVYLYPLHGVRIAPNYDFI